GPPSQSMIATHGLAAVAALAQRPEVRHLAAAPRGPCLDVIDFRGQRPLARLANGSAPEDQLAQAAPVHAIPARRGGGPAGADLGPGGPVLLWLFGHGGHYPCNGAPKTRQPRRNSKTQTRRLPPAGAKAHGPALRSAGQWKYSAKISHKIM